MYLRIDILDTSMSSRNQYGTMHKCTRYINVGNVGYMKLILNILDEINIHRYNKYVNTYLILDIQIHCDRRIQRSKGTKEGERRDTFAIYSVSRGK